MAGETQTITVIVERPAAVVYQAFYSDGKHAGDDDYYGGNAAGQTDAKGVYRDSWVVDRRAPPGPVHVSVSALAEQDLARARVEFRIGRDGADCAA